jgi:hypothetical protein
MRVLQFLGWLLIVLAVLVFFGVLFLVLWIPQVSAPALIGTAVVPAGLLLTLGGLLLTKSREANETAEKRSQFYLESCRTAYEEAKNLLADEKNDRVTWIAAGRALKHAHGLAKEVRVDAHRRVLELYQLKYRRFFDEALRDRPASFFYGAKDMSIPIAEAAAASSVREERVGLFPTSRVKELSVESLRAVWEAAQWPNNYEDPLDGAVFSEKDERSLMVRFPGLYEFLEHRRKQRTGSAKLGASGESSGK